MKSPENTSKSNSQVENTTDFQFVSTDDLPQIDMTSVCSMNNEFFPAEQTAQQQTAEQTNKQTAEQTDEQTNKQTDEQTNKEPTEQTAEKTTSENISTGCLCEELTLF